MKRITNKEMLIADKRYYLKNKSTGKVIERKAFTDSNGEVVVQSDVFLGFEDTVNYNDIIGPAPELSDWQIKDLFNNEKALGEVSTGYYLTENGHITGKGHYGKKEIIGGPFDTASVFDSVLPCAIVPSIEYFKPGSFWILTESMTTSNGLIIPKNGMAVVEKIESEKHRMFDQERIEVNITFVFKNGEATFALNCDFNNALKFFEPTEIL